MLEVTTSNKDFHPAKVRAGLLFFSSVPKQFSLRLKGNFHVLVLQYSNNSLKNVQMCSEVTARVVSKIISLSFP